MSDRDETMRALAAVRRNLEDLEEEISTAKGAMPKDDQIAAGGRRNYMTVVKRLDDVGELADETAERLRSVLRDLD